MRPEAPTHPPLKAPTGFLTGTTGTTSANLLVDEANDLDRSGEGAVKERELALSLEMKARDAMAGSAEQQEAIEGSR